MNQIKLKNWEILEEECLVYLQNKYDLINFESCLK